MGIYTRGIYEEINTTYRKGEKEYVTEGSGRELAASKGEICTGIVGARKLGKCDVDRKSMFGKATPK